MKKFIKKVGRFLLPDFIMYSIFKFIMLNLNWLSFLILLSLNVWFYIIFNEQWILSMNSIFSFLIVLWYCFVFFDWLEADNENFGFETSEYKTYFKDIEYGNR